MFFKSEAVVLCGWMASSKTFKQKVGRVFRLPHAALLARRTRRHWPRIADSYRYLYGIDSVAPPRFYRKFIADFKPFSVGKFKLAMRKASHEGNVMFSVTRWTRGFPRNPFRIKFALTSSIEHEFSHPIDRFRPDAVLAIMGLQGPSKRKYASPTRLVNEMNRVVKEPWQNFVLKEFVAFARREGLEAVALLRPEHNPSLSEGYFRSKGLDLEALDGSRRQFYAAARKAGFKKIAGSRYFWIFFNRE